MISMLTLLSEFHKAILDTVLAMKDARVFEECIEAM